MEKAAFLAALTMTAVTAGANVSLPAIFGDHMVVQQDAPLPVWGKADPGEPVTVTLAGRTAQAVTADDGTWSVTLEPISDPGPHTLTVEGKNTIELTDVLAGEVWLCSGQSNMQWPMHRSDRAEEEIPKADHPQIRLFQVERKLSAEPVEDVQGKWVVCSPETVKEFSAVAYFFGRDLQEALDVNVGLVHSSYGGSTIEAWLPPETLATMKEPHTSPEPAQTKDAVLHHAMVRPLMPFAVRGFVWYQGESNGWAPPIYGERLTALINLWREQFEGPDPQPFLIVQLPAYGPRTDDPNQRQHWVNVRKAQQDVAEQLPAVSMAVTLDLGDAEDIHPTNKHDVGHRLALLALRDTYGQEVIAQGPQAISAQRQDDGSVRVTFEETSPLQLANDASQTFKLANAQGQWAWATPEKVDDHTLRLTAEGLEGQPTQVRYAWQTNPPSVLTNEAGLPAAPFELEVSAGE